MIVAMAEHPNLEIARRAWRAVSESDVDTLGALFADGIVWHATGRGTPWEGAHRGRDEVIDYLARIGESVEIFDARLDDVLVSSDRVAYIMHVSASRGDRGLEVDYQLLGRIENGLVVEVWTTPLDPIALEAFWS
jgi:ketosteroid isomerase-like protein